MATNQRFTEKAQEAILTAQRETQERRLSQLEPEAVLYGLLDQSDGVVPKLQYSAEPAVSSGTRKVLEQAEKEARQFGDEYISTEHLLLGVLSVSGSPAARLLQRHGLTSDKAKAALKEIRGSQRVTDPNPEGKYQALERYGRDLTELAEKGKLDPVIGRDEEIRRVIQVLSRRTKNNPVLIGEPGVG